MTDDTPGEATGVYVHGMEALKAICRVLVTLPLEEMHAINEQRVGDKHSGVWFGCTRSATDAAS
jgi:hypothetical protein